MVSRSICLILVVILFESHPAHRPACVLFLQGCFWRAVSSGQANSSCIENSMAWVGWHDFVIVLCLSYPGIKLTESNRERYFIRLTESVCWMSTVLAIGRTRTEGQKERKGSRYTGENWVEKTEETRWVSCAGTSSKMIHVFYLPWWQLNQCSFKRKPVLGRILAFCRIRQGVPGQSLWSGLKLFGIKFAFFHSWLHLCFEYLGMFLVACWQNSTGKKFVKLALLAARKVSECKVEMWETSHSARRARTFGCYTPLEKICCNVKHKPQRSDKARRRLLELLTKLLLDF